MSDDFDETMTWYTDGGIEVTPEMERIARYFWNSAVLVLQHKLERILAELKQDKD